MPGSGWLREKAGAAVQPQSLCDLNDAVFSERYTTPREAMSAQNAHGSPSVTRYQPTAFGSACVVPIVVSRAPDWTIRTAVPWVVDSAEESCQAPSLSRCGPE